MMGELKNHAMWNEPLVGALFGEFYYERAAHKRGATSILGTPHRKLRLKHIRTMVLEGTAARYPEVECVVIKEPHGSTGAPLLSAALPESRLVFLVRDPRDVAASALDGKKEGSWTSKAPRWRKTDKPKTLADTDPESFMKNRASTY